MIRIINAVHRMDDIMTTVVTMGTGAIVAFPIDSILAVIASALAILFWIPRIKRQVNEYHGGSFIAYIKFIFRKK